MKQYYAHLIDKEPFMTYQIRLATVDEIAMIIHQRNEMFAEMGWKNFFKAGMDEAFENWVRPRMEQEVFLTWFAISDSGEIVGGAGLWIREGTPDPTDFATQRGYVMNVYVEPDHRRQGLARLLMQTLMDWCKDHQLYNVNLHASDAGRPLYEKLGFNPVNEMSIFLG